MAHTTAVYDVFLVERIVAVKRCVIDEETVHRVVNTAVPQLQISNIGTSLNRFSRLLKLTGIYLHYLKPVVNGRNDTQVQGRPKAPPATQDASQKSLGDKIRKLGTKFKFGQLILSGK